MIENINPSQPLTPAVFHILMALADGEKHGYSIMKDVERQTNGKIKLGPGTLYGSIKRMLAAGLIEESEERPDPVLDDERRRYYRLSGPGQAALSEECRRLDQAVKIARIKQVLTCI
ncbi:MAG: PadR family transcriptional regulator [Leptolinea sp.]|jgi:DNA-binding PadR family transcriptional regulator|nr:PadR family transcriptional regulator [Leptolinea sp.]